jgi:hypothetical protein
MHSLVLPGKFGRRQSKCGGREAGLPRHLARTHTWAFSEGVMNGDSHERERLTRTREPSGGSSIARELGGGQTTSGTADQARIRRVYWQAF